ncbi:MAG: urease accessory protein UreD [Ferruginibacter sp.]
MNAQLHIQVADRGGCSYLKQAFFTTPFKVANITEDKKSKHLQLMLMSASPGILDGDVYDLKIEVEENCSLQLHTQAYQRLFNMKQGASQQLDVHVAPGASFNFLPHPSVPHKQSSFIGRNNFYLGNNSTLLFGEVLTCGRKLNGELFKFTKYHSITQVFVSNKLVIKENLLMQPSLVDVNSIGQLEGYTHQASMIWLDEFADVKQLQEQLVEMLSAEVNIEYGVTMAPVNGLIIRLLGNGAEQLYDCLQRISKIITEEVNHKSAKLIKEH